MDLSFRGLNANSIQKRVNDVLSLYVFRFYERIAVHLLHTVTLGFRMREKFIQEESMDDTQIIED